MSNPSTNKVTKVTSNGEILQPFSVSDAVATEHKASELYRAAERNYVRFAAELRRLQDGGAHLKRGYSSFGSYAEATFDGLNTNTARQLSRQGQVLLILEGESRIDLDAEHNTLPRSRGVRALAVVLGKSNPQIMLDVYDHAIASGRGITEDSVQASMLSLFPPKPLELGAGKEPEDLPEENEEDRIEAERHHELLDRIEIIRQYLDYVVDELEDNRLEKAKSRYLDDVCPEMLLLGKELDGEYDSQWITERRGEKTYDEYNHGD